ncbi:hypothetical protein GIB67_041003 [Kingdonia uniflora]|uniref:TTI1 C-terminal TPR domain-containing protein n=1 Tax=Kingdonia uniflora TaxID=39325 RepID=A0A7J7NBY1_9MAGN|nr:hypothetical protein GIB67_041003 [Kingdonia uniflora]
MVLISFISSKQVIINGLGVFTVCLGKDFTSKGFLHSSLYLLLEKLICSSSQIRRASDAVLHVISVSSGYPNVGKLVLANADYVIDSLCRQLRHLDLNPHVPNVLAAMLSSVGVANDILPLLEEPLRSVSLELEVLGRHQHPDLTIPFLKAVAEIVKASKHESYTMSTQAESYYMNVKLKLSDMKSENAHFDNCNADIQLEHWEEMLFKLNESRRYRRTVGSVTGSCLIATTPLVSSVKEAACLVALDIIEDGITALAKVEEAYAHESKTKGAILRAIQMGSFHDLQDALEATDEGTDENRLLPAVNKIWPYLVVCIKNKNPMTTRRCLGVVSSVVQISGGDFFSRRFHNDGPHFWKILATSPFQKKPISRDETTPLRLPYRANSNLSEESTAETATLKTQTAALHMIADLSKNKKSAPALEAVLKKVSGLVVGIACSSVVGLRNASINALTGLSCIDSDLIWLLLADVYFSLKKKKDVPSPPMTDLPEMSQLLPSPTYPKEYLYLQYGGESFGFGVDSLSVEIVFKKLQLVLESQLFRNV